MADRYAALARSPLGRRVVPRLGLPDPVPLRRDAPGAPIAPGPVVVAALPDVDAPPPGGSPGATAAQVLRAAGADVRAPSQVPGGPAGGVRTGGLVLDATTATDPADLTGLQRFFAPRLRGLATCGRVVVLGLDPAALPEGAAASTRVAQRALEGFTRSLGKEVGRGSTVQLVSLAPGGQEALGSVLRFLVSGRSAFVSGQVVRVGAPVHPLPRADGAPEAGEGAGEEVGERPLAGRTAVVTGAARGIGASIARLLAGRGADVVVVDVPAAAADLAAVARDVGGSSLVLDVASDLAPGRLARHLRERPGGRPGVDVLVHNAGITRDKRLRNMTARAWAQVMDVNVAGPLRITEHLLGEGLVPAGGRVVGVSSLAGIAGNDGQTNYAASKAGVIGMVDALAPAAAALGATVNAVAPGFVETRMTAAVPLATREAGRRLSSLRQGGLPVDVAEAVAWLAEPGAAGITGQVLRVCGQNLLGA